MTGRYQEYPEYRDSGVKWLGGVPISWDVIPLKHLAELNPKKSGIKEKKLSELCSFLPMEKLKLNSLKLDETKNVSDVYDGYTYFENEDLLIAKVTPCFENKNMAIAKELHNGLGFGSSEIYVLRANAKLNNQFLFYRLQEDSFMEIAIAAMSGAGGLKRVPAEIINTYTAAFPCIQEQQKIANFLDHETAKIVTLIAKQEKLIALLKEKRQAVISHAVTRGLPSPNGSDTSMKDSGVEWLGEVPEHWEVGRYKFCTKRIIVGIAEAATHAYADSGVPIVRSTNIKEEELETHNLLFLKPEFAEKNSSKYLFHNDVVTVRTGYPGISAVVPERLNNSHCFTNLVATPLEQHHPKYLSEYLNSYIGKAYFDLFSWGSAQQNISVPILQNFPIAFPSKNEELEIVEYVKTQRDKFKKLIKYAEYSIELMKERKTALISAAVTGKIDVRNWQDQ